ncbi:MAG: endolytic transglycosylase MltG [Firmicutes bacterium]|nr:endolytic transglycosylase MltG [Bacillota bacterium]
MAKVGALIVDGINRLLKFCARNIKNAVIFIGAALLLGGIMVASYSTTFNFIKTDEFRTYDPNGEVITINIPEGSTAKEIGELLKEAGLIDNVLLFRIKAKLTGAENNFQYGVYKIVDGMPDETIMDVLQEGGKAESVTITIPEGWSIRQIGQYLEEQNICLASEFEAACNRTDYDFDYYGYINRRSDREYLLEGYLWPDTYEIIPSNGAEGIVKRMLREFERKWERHVLWKQQMNEMGLTIDQVMTMASCIEREAMLAEEAPKVSRVLYNRNEAGLPWGLNCTILYALQKEGTGEDYVSYSDLEIDSRYNTYMYSGFPVGAICNPGQTAIEAVLNPAEGDWLYFIGFDDGSGEHLFTADYDEFLAVQNGTYDPDAESEEEGWYDEYGEYHEYSEEGWYDENGEYHEYGEDEY